MTIGELFRLILPVFALIGLGVVLRRARWIEGVAEASLLKLVVYVCMPGLVFETIVGNADLRNPANLFLPPLAGFVSTVGGFGVAYLAGRRIGLAAGSGLRTFAPSAGIGNYSYLPLPIVGGIWGVQAQGVVLVHNVGVDLALWSVGVLVLTGSTAGAWRRIVTPMLVTILAAIAINLAWLAAHVPGVVHSMARSLGACAIPIVLLLTGTNLADYLDEPRKLLHPKVAAAACAVRLAILPALILCLARWLPCSADLKRVLVVQAAMPSAVFPIIMARYFGGQPLTAVQVVLSTTAIGFLTCPFWIRAGLAWAGVG